MRIGGKLPHSLLDYPGQVAVVVFTCGCNLDCIYCHNQELLSAPATISVEDMLAFLEKRHPLINHLVITGGEPTLHQDLPDFCSKAKQLGYRIKLDTNGTKPHELEFLLTRNLIDYVAMDLKTDPDNYQHPFLVSSQTKPKGMYLRASMALLAESGIPHEYRTTAIQELVTVEVLVKLNKLQSFIYEQRPEGRPSWYLQKATQTRGGFTPYTSEDSLRLLATEAMITEFVHIR